MFNQLLIFPEKEEHYFSVSNSIFCRKRNRGNSWSDAEPIVEGGVASFCAYGDDAGISHIIHTDADNNLYYSQSQNHQTKTHCLSAIPAGIAPKSFRLYPVGGRLNLLYSAKYQEDYILVHCILGNQAKPHIVARLNSPHFWVFKTQVYYSGSQGNIGYTKLEDEKPEGFTTLFENGKNVSVLEFDGTEIVVYTRENKLFANKNELVYDSRMEMPTLYLSQGKPYIMWKSGGYVRYVELSRDGTALGSPMRFMASDAEIQIFHVQTPTDIGMLYGYNTQYGLHLFGKPDLIL